MYKQLFTPAEAEIEVKKSRFIGNCFPIKTLDETQEILLGLRKEHFNARHICFAYLLEGSPPTERCSDDGEPSQTAGLPILEALKGAEIHNAIVCVTRYFGGVLLGTGGLSRAYRQAAQEALACCETAEVYAGERYTILLDYTAYGKAENYLREQGVVLTNTTFTDCVTLEMAIPQPAVESVKKTLSDISGGSISWDNYCPCKYLVKEGQFQDYL